MQQTHYDTLKVSRDAPVEVIRAAYRVLCQKYHPDLHPSDAAATGIMTLLNKAYEVLSDPERRHAYDAWIHQNGTESAPGPAPKAKAARPARVRPEAESSNYAALTDPVGRRLWGWGLLCASLLLAVTLVVVLSVANRPQMYGWMVVPPVPEDRDAYIRKLAREVISVRGGDSNAAAVPTAPVGAALPSDNSPASVPKDETPTGSAQLLPARAAPRPSDSALSAQRAADDVRATRDFNPAFPSNEPVLPFVAEPHEAAATRFAESYQGDEVVGGSAQPDGRLEPR